MSTVNIDLDVECNECGEDLELSNGRYGRITAEPCETCMKKAKDEAYNEGYEKGEQNASDDL